MKKWAQLEGISHAVAAANWNNRGMHLSAQFAAQQQTQSQTALNVVDAFDNDDTHAPAYRMLGLGSST